jgi:hypothetical protein
MTEGNSNVLDQQRYTQIVRNLFTLATEAEIYGDSEENGLIVWQALSQWIFAAAINGTNGILSDDELIRLANEADEATRWA